MHQRRFECGKKANAHRQVASGSARVFIDSKPVIIAWKLPAPFATIRGQRHLPSSCATLSFPRQSLQTALLSGLSKSIHGRERLARNRFDNAEFPVLLCNYTGKEVVE
jgi:hypothetical protein